jgi:hypothetical protein
VARRAGSYRFDRQRKEDVRKAKQDAKRQRKTDRQDSGRSGPEMGEPQVSAPADGYTWFSPTRNRIVTTATAEPPATDDVTDWTLIETPEAPSQEPA